MCSQVLQEQIVATIQLQYGRKKIQVFQAVERIQEQIFEPIDVLAPAMTQRFLSFFDRTPVRFMWSIGALVWSPARTQDTTKFVQFQQKPPFTNPHGAQLTRTSSGRHQYAFHLQFGITEQSFLCVKHIVQAGL